LTVRSPVDSAGRGCSTVSIGSSGALPAGAADVAARLMMKTL
jgi:hypothetical protein